MRKKKMTNKVIIDYTQCKYYQKGECEAEIDYNGNYCDYTCESDVMNDCYYKQLQRKTQECEKLKEENEELEKLVTKEPMTESYYYGVQLNDTVKVFVKQAEAMQFMNGITFVDPEADVHIVSVRPLI